MFSADCRCSCMVRLWMLLKTVDAVDALLAGVGLSMSRFIQSLVYRVCRCDLKVLELIRAVWSLVD